MKKIFFLVLIITVFANVFVTAADVNVGLSYINGGISDNLNDDLLTGNVDFPIKSVLGYLDINKKYSDILIDFNYAFDILGLNGDILEYNKTPIVAGNKIINTSGIGAPDKISFIDFSISKNLTDLYSLQAGYLTHGISISGKNLKQDILDTSTGIKTENTYADKWINYNVETRFPYLGLKLTAPDLKDSKYSFSINLLINGNSDLNIEYPVYSVALDGSANGSGLMIKGDLIKEWKENLTFLTNLKFTFWDLTGEKDYYDYNIVYNDVDYKSSLSLFKLTLGLNYQY